METEAVFEPHKSNASGRFQTEILTLLKDGVMSGDDLIEDYVEVYSGVREALLATPADAEISPHLFARFLKDWHRRMKVAHADWVALLVPRALFSLGWSFRRSGEVFGITDSKVRLYALRAIQEKSGYFARHISKQCARNDLYLIDVLLNQGWNDPLGIYRPEHFHKHRAVCARCAEVFKVAQTTVLQWKEESVRTVPVEIDLILRAQKSIYGSGLISHYHRLNWINKLGIQILGSASILALVLLVPFYQKIDIGRFFRDTSDGSLVTKSLDKLPDSDEPVPTDEASAQLAANGVKVEGDTGKDSAGTEVAGGTAGATASAAGESTLLAKGPDAAPVAKGEGGAISAAPTSAPPKASQGPVASTPLPSATGASPKTDPVKTATSSPLPIAAASPAVKVPVSSTTPVAAANSAAASSTSTAIPAMPTGATHSTTTVPGKGFFYRWGARSNDPEIVAASVKKTLEKFAASKAGELDLGAEYKGGRYFHFTVDAASYESLIGEVRTIHFQDFSSTRTESDRKDDPKRIRIVFWIGPTKL